MKVYVNGYDFSNININYEHTFKNTFIYTNECIYTTHKKELHKVEYKTDVKEYNYNDYCFFLDNTKILYTDVIQHIPYYHLCCEETINKTNIGEGIYFIKNSYYDQDSYYFETDNNDEMIFNKIISFLSSN